MSQIKLCVADNGVLVSNCDGFSKVFCSDAEDYLHSVLECVSSLLNPNCDSQSCDPECSLAPVPEDSPASDESSVDAPADDDSAVAAV